MAKIECKDGALHIGTNVVAEPETIEYNEEVASKDAFAMGDTRPERKYRPGLIVGSVTFFWDPTDTNGQVAISANGTASAVTVYPTGQNEGDTEISFGNVAWGNDGKTGEAEGWWKRTVEFSAESLTEGTYTTS